MTDAPLLPPSAPGPPRPRLAFRVGIVGHRPNRLKNADVPALSALLSQLLQAIKLEAAETLAAHPDAFAPAPPILRAVSPLAEGADSLFAAAALPLGYELCCPMPFSREEFENDFLPPTAIEPGALERFAAVRQNARQSTALVDFELDGDRADPPRAYAACGRVVMNQSDLLIVLWDGQRTTNRGGTEETLADAREAGVTVLWIDAHAPHPWRLLPPSATLNLDTAQRASPATSDSLDTLRTTVRRLLTPPPPASPPDRDVTLADYFADRKSRINPAVIWTFFRNLLGDGRLSFPSPRVKDFERAVAGDWPRSQATTTARVIDFLRPFYAWPDKLSVRYADTYRSAFVVAYLLAAGAVGMALLPLAVGWSAIPHHPGEVACTIAEFIMITFVLGIVFRGRRRRWHGRWINYRIAAELIRPLRLLAPLGGSLPTPNVTPHLAGYGHPASTWMAWYARAVQRHLGLPAARVDRAHLQSCLAELAGLLRSQIAFHEATAGRCHRMETRLRIIGAVLLTLTLLACIAHLLPAVVHVEYPPPARPCLTFLAAFLPALGAALAAIANQAELRRLTKRSTAMEGQLAALLSAASALQTQLAQPAPLSQPSQQALALAHQAAQTMINEVLDWRVVFLDRPLETA